MPKSGPQDSVAAMVAEFDKRRKIVVEELNKLDGVSCIMPKGAFYAFPNIGKTGFKAKELASALLEKAGVATIGTGATIARLAERSVVRGAARQLAISIAAAAVTYAVGALAGERVSA